MAIILLKSKLFNWGTVDLQVLISWIYLWVPPPHLSACKGLVRKNGGRREPRIVIGQKQTVGGHCNQASGYGWVKTKA